MLTKRMLITTAALALAGGTARAEEAPREIRIGYQKSGVLLIAKAQALLESRFPGTKLSWVEFSFGPPLLEALSAGAIEYGATGDSPPIFAQAARAKLKYVAVQAGRGQTQGIIVPPNSPLRSLTDLKGRKLGIAKASSAHSLAIAAIESVGLKFDDVQAEYLAPADASAAFTRGAIDAWSIWDPFLATAELNRGARRLPISEAASTQNSYFLANRDFIRAYPAAVGAINEELARATAWPRCAAPGSSNCAAGGCSTCRWPTARRRQSCACAASLRHRGLRCSASSSPPASARPARRTASSAR